MTRPPNDPVIPTAADAPPPMGSDRSFGLVFAAVFAIVGLWPLKDGGEVRWWSLAVAVGCLLIAIAQPHLLAPLNRLWFKFGLLLARIINPLVMAAIFLLAVTPIGLMMRLSGKDPMQLKARGRRDSYWVLRDPPGPTADSMKNQV